MELTRIPIDGKMLPIRIDLNVLDQIEERYDTKQKFQQELLGFRFKRGEDGKYERTEDGRIAIEYAKPSLKALIFILPRMINEGLKAEAYDTGKAYEPLEADWIIAACEMDREYLYSVINDELTRCERVKKDMPGKASKKSSNP